MKAAIKLSLIPVCIFIFFLTGAQNLKKGTVPEDALYKNPRVDIEKRTDDLIARMTIDEKLAQLCYREDTISGSEYGVGFFGFMTSHLSPSEAAREYNAFQKHQVEKTRLGIPAFRSGEGIYTYMGNGSTSFPQPIGLASSFDPEVVAGMAEILAKELGSRGIRLVYSPVVNLARDSRWGRTNETYGEDPYLSSVMGTVYVKSMEAAGISAMPKHFVANIGLDGKFSGPVHFSERLLRENYFPAFKACFDAGASAVMMAYNTLDGIPCTINKWLITDILKNEWGFKGFVRADGGAMDIVYEAFGTHETPELLAADAINAGCDVSSPSWFYLEPLKKALKQGIISESIIDESVRRVLRQKFESGLFENPYADPDYAGQVNNAPEHRMAALEASRKSLVLLKNDGNVLPFNKNVRKVAVTGPLGDWLIVNHYGGYGRPEVTVLDGIKNLLPNAEVNYQKGVEMQYFAYPAIDERFITGKIKAEYFNNVDLQGKPLVIKYENKIEYDWKEKSPEGMPADNFSVRWTGKIRSPVTGKVKIGATVDDGVRLWLDDKLIIDMWSGGARRLAECEVNLEKNKIYDFKMEYFDNGFRAYAQLGWDVDVNMNITKAVELAKQSDVIVAVVGMEEDENEDRANLDLSEEQEALIHALAKLDKPLVVVIQSGTVITMNNWISEVPAVMVAWYPGCEGGNAIAEAIFGEFSPGGKLAVTFPKVTGQVPLNYNHLPEKPGDVFIGYGNEPLFCFGHGLSYANFEYSDLRLSKSAIEKDEPLIITFNVKNTGERQGDEVPQLYIHDKYASVSQPVKKLVDFKRITLRKGESKTITFALSSDKLKIWDINMNHVVEPGEFEIMIGSSSCDIRLKESFWVNEAGQRFFSYESFWNKPIPEDAEADPRSDYWISLLKQEPTREYFGISFMKWTIPVYEADSTTPVYEIKKHYLSEEEKVTWDTERETFGHGPGFDYVPVPKNAEPDPEEDSHLAIIDRQRKIAWDMWGFRKLPDGTFESKTGMKYPLDGDGTFKTEDFDIKNGESIHFHGPSRAAGVPAFAGLIMYEEVMEGEIRHKLSCATRYNAFQEFVYPASWTDGFVEGGIPEGAVIQLDPNLDLTPFNLTREETVIAKALQKYGMVIVDVAQGQPIYAEGLWGHPEKSWEGKIRDWNGGINDIPYDHYRVLKVENAVKKGDARFRRRSYWD